jgi:PAT family beta-lactamase induction signal transducer AmpG
MAQGHASAGSWIETCKAFLDRRVAALFFLGFVAGLPYLLVFSTLSIWLREVGIERSTIGFLSWVATFYSIKVLWAPVVDRVSIPWLTRAMGRRRSWMLVAQAGIVIGLLGMAASDPAQGLGPLVAFALITAFASATQDIAIDAYRIEAAPPYMQGPLAGSYNFGYRVGLLVAGAGALYIAEYASWLIAYATMGAAMLVGVATVLFIAEPAAKVDRAALLEEERVTQYLRRFADLTPRVQATIGWLYGAVACPFTDFVRRMGWIAAVILVFIAIYKLSDVVMGVMAGPFYVDVGFSKSDIASVTKIFGFAMSVTGGLIGGVLVVRYGVIRPLVFGAFLVGLPNLLFALLAHQGRSDDLWLLILAISGDNLGGGIAGTVLIAYLSSLTSSAYTATQYALFSSLMSLPGRFVGGWSGVMVDAMGYRDFFIMTTIISLPAIVLAWYLARRSRAMDNNQSAAVAAPASTRTGQG